VLPFISATGQIPSRPPVPTIIFLPGIKRMAHLHGSLGEKQWPLENSMRKLDLPARLRLPQHAFYVFHRWRLPVFLDLFHVICVHLQRFKVETVLPSCNQSVSQLILFYSSGFQLLSSQGTF
jgi:hypothetical protein